MADREAIDEVHPISRKRGSGRLRREARVDARGRVTRDNLACTDHAPQGGDNGRAVGCDDQHGRHHRHGSGKVGPIDFASLEETGMKTVVPKAAGEQEFLRRGRALARLAAAGQPLPEEDTPSFEDPAALPRLPAATRRAAWRAVSEQPATITGRVRLGAVLAWRAVGRVTPARAGHRTAIDRMADLRPSRAVDVAACTDRVAGDGVLRRGRTGRRRRLRDGAGRLRQAVGCRRTA